MKTFIISILVLLASISSVAQWEFSGVFPDPNNMQINQTGGIHGIAVDPEGKIWSINYYDYQRDAIYIAANKNQNVPVCAVYVFNPDGTPASFSPIKFVTINGIVDTLGGYTKPDNTWEPRTGRGMRSAPDGNIVVAMYDTYYKINYKTGEGINKLTPLPGTVVTAPAFSDNGHMFTASVVPGNPVKEYDENFNFIQDVITSSIGYSRAFEVGSDGLSLYWAGYTNNCVYKYTRPNTSSLFQNYEIILKGFVAESFCWNPKTNLLWISSGSGADLPNMYSGELSYYSYCTWYGYNITKNSIQDSIKWTNLMDPYWQRPRAIAFSPNGKTAYVGMFGDINYDGIQKFEGGLKVLAPNGGEIFFVNSNYNINWSNNTGDVKLEFSPDNGSSWQSITDRVSLPNREYSWKVPDVKTIEALVKVTEIDDPASFDVSDNTFIISDPPSIALSIDSIKVKLNEGDSTQTSFKISNNGPGYLNYNISAEYTGAENNSGQTQSKISFLNSNIKWSNFKNTGINPQIAKRKVISVVKSIDKNLPVIISDPVGDGGWFDVKDIRGKADKDSIYFQIDFNTNFAADSYIGYLGLDIDCDPLTGVPLPGGLSQQTIGCEFYAYISITQNYPYIYLIDKYNNSLIYVYPILTSNSIYFSFPSYLINDDDNVINIAAVFGNYSTPTDWIPDDGFGVLGGNWLSFDPLDGTISPNENKDISLNINSSKLVGGKYLANVLVSNNDPQNSMVRIPVTLTVISQPKLVTSNKINFRDTYVGYPSYYNFEIWNKGSKALSISDIKTDNPVFKIEGEKSFNILPHQKYIEKISFDPDKAEAFTGNLSFLSNDPDSVTTIILLGTAIYPPSISVSSQSLSFNMMVGDSLQSSIEVSNVADQSALDFEIIDRREAVANNSIFNSIKTRPTKIETNSKPDHSKILHKINKGFVSVNNINLTSSIPSFQSLSLPEIITDPVGDGGDTDIKEVDGYVSNNLLQMSIKYADIADMQKVFQIILLDVDQNINTGNYDYYFQIGIDYYLELWGSDSVYVYDSGYNLLGFIPTTIKDNEIDFALNIQSTSIKNDINFAVESGNIDLGYVEDYAPDNFFATIIGDAGWISESPGSGEISGKGKTIINLDVKTKNLIGGVYQASLFVMNNDPSNSLLQISVNLKLKGIPQIKLESDSIDLGTAFIGYSSKGFIKINNPGTDSLLGNIRSNNSAFVIPDSSFNIPAFGSKNIEIKFCPTKTGTENVILSITSNALTASIEIHGKGFGIEPPVISLKSNSISMSVQKGDSLFSSFNILNKGGSDLTCKITDIDIDSPEERLFGVYYGYIYEINPGNGSIIRSLQAPEMTYNNTGGLAYYNSKIFFATTSSTTKIYIINSETGETAKSFAVPSTNIAGLAYIQPYLYILELDYPAKIRVINPDNTQTIKYINPDIICNYYNSLGGSLGRLFVAVSDNEGEKIYELNPDDGKIINSFTTANYANGLAFTGKHIFTSNMYSGADEYDPDSGTYLNSFYNCYYSSLAGEGQEEANWLNEYPTDCIINRGDSCEIKIVGFTRDMVKGKHNANIVVYSNDPSNLTNNIKVTIDVIDNINQEIIPNKFSLYQNYPNPFNPSTTISYDLPSRSSVTLKIYNIIGEEVATLINAEQIAGKYKINWNGSGLASGVYLYRLNAGNFVDTKKLILLK